MSQIELPRSEGIYAVNLLPVEANEPSEAGSAPLVLRRQGKGFVAVLELSKIARTVKATKALPEGSGEVRIEGTTLEETVRRAIGEAILHTGRPVIAIEPVAPGKIAVA